MTSRRVVGATALSAVSELPAVADGLVRPASASTGQILPVLPELSDLLPHRGLRRGSTVSVVPGRPARSGGSSLVLALLAEASRAGAWCAVVGVPTFGAVAAAELGIALERVALVPYPGPEWATVVAALIDGVDVVVAAVPPGVTASVATRLAARARQRGAVLVPYGDWERADVTLRVVRSVWEGLGRGRGRLRRRQLTVSACGRGAAAQPREARIWLPGDTATVAAAPSRPPARRASLRVVGGAA
ncbi:MAG TPA: hypothetical protein VIL44_03040 [Micromonospora sp.]